LRPLGKLAPKLTQTSSADVYTARKVFEYKHLGFRVENRRNRSDYQGA